MNVGNGPRNDEEIVVDHRTSEYDYKSKLQDTEIS